MLKQIHSKQVVAIMAHPDDAELTCFGTLLKYVRENYKVHVIIVCTGEQGISVSDRQQHGVNHLEKALRLQESVSAFSNTGITLECLNYVDGELMLNHQLISGIEQRLQKLQPEILITHWSQSPGFEHQDHIVVGQASLNAALRCCSIQLILQTEPLHAIRNQFIPNYFVNITDFFKQKIFALQQHQSQLGRYYLTEDFHRLKSRQHAVTAGSEFYKQGLLFEAFIANLNVQL